MTRLIFSMLCLYIVISVDSYEVKSTLGRIRGKFVKDEQFDVEFYSFLGIPYAAPPVGKLRFKAPVERTPWAGVFYATRPGTVCPQTEWIHSRPEMNENCLSFNVYTPTAVANLSLPVIFSIHDGDFNVQSGNPAPMYGPELFMKNNNVLVTINYRLGALGFLSLSTKENPGNNGIRDVILALKVVRDNIGFFGGDPNKITLRGNGAGACMAQYLMLTNQTDGMFRNAMALGGSVLSPKYIQINPRANALALAKELGLDLSSDDVIMDQLRFVTAYDIVRAQDAIAKRDPKRGLRYYFPFKPTVEVEHEAAVLTKTPLALMTEGAIRDLTMFVGFNDQEGLEIYPLLTKEPELIDKLNANFKLSIPDDIQYPEDSVECDYLASRIKNFYFDGRNMSLANMQNIVNLVSDLDDTYSIDHFVKLFKAKKSSPVYYSIFAVDSELNWYKAFANITFPGAAHADNIGYAFVTSFTKSRYSNLSATVKEIQNSFLRNLQSLASTGGPPLLVYVEAGQSRSHTITTINGLTKVYSSPLPNRIGFWSSIYENYRSNVTQYTQVPENKMDAGFQPNSTTTPSTTDSTTTTNSTTNSTTGLIPAVLGLVTNTVGGLLSGLLG